MELAAVTALTLRICVCGHPKERGNAFCGICYHALPGQMQRALWRRVGHGFEEAYAAAQEWLGPVIAERCGR